MNKIPVKSIVFFFGVVICFAVNAQPKWGLRTGMNFNEITLEDAPALPLSYFRKNVGFHVGGFGEFSLVKNLYAHVELQYIQKGANSSDYDTTPSTDTRINLHYVEAPVLISYKIFKIINLEAGPSISCLLSATETPADSSKDLDQIFSNDFDFGLNGGIRIAVYKNVALWGRYYYGLTRPATFSYLPTTSYDSKIKNFQVGLGYLF